MTVRQLLRLILFVLPLTLGSGCGEQDKTRFLDDRAGLLSETEQARLTRYNEKLLEDLDIHFKLIVSDTKLDNINRDAAELFADLGKETRAAKGLLFLIDPEGEQLRIEVGYDLEAIFPDIFVGYIEQRQMVPFFQAGNVGPGIESAVELLVARMIDSIAGHRFDPNRELPDLTYFSGGGGARSKLEIGSGLPAKARSEDRTSYRPGTTPEATLEMYMDVLRNHVKDPELPLFTPETRTFFTDWVVTDAQQDNELHTLEQATEHETLTNAHFGVIRYPIQSRTLPPYFFRKDDSGWMIDFATMSRVLQMNHRNMWVMHKTDHPYMFGFEDWVFDTNGFPVEEGP